MTVNVGIREEDSSPVDEEVRLIGRKMKIFRQIDEIEQASEPVVTIGTFDGVHRGHQHLIQRLNRKKAERNGTSYLITFHPHPQIVLDSRESPVRLLTSLDEKITLLQKLGIDRLVILPFSKEFARLTGEEFIQEILVERIGVKEIVIGYDHAFGYRRSGNIDTVQKLGKQFGYKTTVVPPFELDGQRVKSSLIRRLLEEGRLEAAEQMLGRAYEIWGRVVPGQGRGKQMNFPTANLAPDDPHKLIPANGIYAGRFWVRGRWHDAAISIGVRPTFRETKRIIEAFILRFNESIYGEKVKVQLLRRLREERRFPTVDALVEQMRRDVEEVREILNQVQNEWRNNAVITRGESEDHSGVRAARKRHG